MSDRINVRTDGRVDAHTPQSSRRIDGNSPIEPRPFQDGDGDPTETDIPRAVIKAIRPTVLRALSAGDCQRDDVGHGAVRGRSS